MTNAPVRRENKQVRSLKFHTRARGNSLGCLPVEISFILDLGTGHVPCVSKNRPLVLVSRYEKVMLLKHSPGARGLQVRVGLHIPSSRVLSLNTFPAFSLPGYQGIALQAHDREHCTSRHDTLIW